MIGNRNDDVTNDVVDICEQIADGMNNGEETPSESRAKGKSKTKSKRNEEALDVQNDDRECLDNIEVDSKIKEKTPDDKNVKVSVDKDISNRDEKTKDNENVVHDAAGFGEESLHVSVTSEDMIDDLKVDGDEKSTGLSGKAKESHKNGTDNTETTLDETTCSDESYEDTPDQQAGKDVNKDTRKEQDKAKHTQIDSIGPTNDSEKNNISVDGNEDHDKMNNGDLKDDIFGKDASTLGTEIKDELGDAHDLTDATENLAQNAGVNVNVDTSNEKKRTQFGNKDETNVSPKTKSRGTLSTETETHNKAFANVEECASDTDSESIEKGILECQTTKKSVSPEGDAVPKVEVTVHETTCSTEGSEDEEHAEELLNDVDLLELTKFGNKGRRLTTDSGISSRAGSFSSEADFQMTDDDFQEMKEYLHGKSDALYQPFEESKLKKLAKSDIEILKAKGENVPTDQTKVTVAKVQTESMSAQNIEKIDWDRVNEIEASVLAGKYLFDTVSKDKINESRHGLPELEILVRKEAVGESDLSLEGKKIDPKDVSPETVDALKSSKQDIMYQTQENKANIPKEKIQTIDEMNAVNAEKSREPETDQSTVSKTKPLKTDATDKSGNDAEQIRDDDNKDDKSSKIVGIGQDGGSDNEINSKSDSLRDKTDLKESSDGSTKTNNKSDKHSLHYEVDSENENLTGDNDFDWEVSHETEIESITRDQKIEPSLQTSEATDVSGKQPDSNDLLEAKRDKDKSNDTTQGKPNPRGDIEIGSEGGVDSFEIDCEIDNTASNKESKNRNKLKSKDNLNDSSKMEHECLLDLDSVAPLKDKRDEDESSDIDISSTDCANPKLKSETETDSEEGIHNFEVDSEIENKAAVNKDAEKRNKSKSKSDPDQMDDKHLQGPESVGENNTRIKGKCLEDSVAENKRDEQKSSTKKEKNGTNNKENSDVVESLAVLEQETFERKSKLEDDSEVDNTTFDDFPESTDNIENKNNRRKNTNDHTEGSSKPSIATDFENSGTTAGKSEASFDADFENNKTSPKPLVELDEGKDHSRPGEVCLKDDTETNEIEKNCDENDSRQLNSEETGELIMKSEKQKETKIAKETEVVEELFEKSVRQTEEQTFDIEDDLVNKMEAESFRDKNKDERELEQCHKMQPDALQNVDSDINEKKSDRNSNQNKSNEKPGQNVNDAQTAAAGQTGDVEKTEVKGKVSEKTEQDETALDYKVGVMSEISDDVDSSNIVDERESPGMKMLKSKITDEDLVSLDDTKPAVPNIVNIKDAFKDKDIKSKLASRSEELEDIPQCLADISSDSIGLERVGDFEQTQEVDEGLVKVTTKKAVFGDKPVAVEQKLLAPVDTVKDTDQPEISEDMIEPTKVVKDKALPETSDKIPVDILTNETEQDNYKKRKTPVAKLLTGNNKMTVKEKEPLKIQWEVQGESFS